MVRPNVHTQAHREVCCTVNFVFEGNCYSVIDGVRFDWQKGDLFVVPNWKLHEHVNTSNDSAILFSINYRPTMELLYKYHEEVFTKNNGHQEVNSVFSKTV